MSIRSGEKFHLIWVSNMGRSNGSVGAPGNFQNTKVNQLFSSTCMKSDTYVSCWDLKKVSDCNDLNPTGSPPFWCIFSLWVCLTFLGFVQVELHRRNLSDQVHIRWSYKRDHNDFKLQKVMSFLQRMRQWPGSHFEGFVTQTECL